jgi:hypothetical protein
MIKNNINLLVYSPTPESGIKYWFKFILFLFVIFFLFRKKIYVHVRKINLFLLATLFIFILGYIILTNARVGSIRSRIFTGARVRNILNKSS